MVKRIADATARELLLAAVILVLATLLRAGWPSLTEFKFSEARLQALALELTDKGRLPLVGVPSSAGFDHSPLSVYLYVPAFLLTSGPIPATIYSGLVGAAAVGLCWWLARRWPGGGPLAALISALLFAVSPWAVAFSRKIWQVTFVPLLTLVFIGLMVSALIRVPAVGSRSPRRWNLAWGIVVYAVLVQVHPSALSLAPALVLWLIIFRRQVRIAPLLLGLLLGALTGLPFLVHQLQNRFPAWTAMGSLPAAQLDWSALRLAWEASTGRSIHALAGEAYPLLDIVPRLGQTFSVIGWLTAIASLGLLWRALASSRSGGASHRQAVHVDVILVSWLAVPIIFNLQHSLKLHLHFFTLIQPAVFLIIGRASQASLNMLRSKAPERVRTVTVIGASLLGLLATAQIVALALMARFVMMHDTPGGFGTPLGRYLEIAEQSIELSSQTNATELLVVGPGNSVVADEIPALFDVLLRNRIPYRFVSGQDAALFPPHRAVALLTPNPGEAAQWYGSWPGQQLESGYRLIALDGSWPQESLQPVETPRTFENGIEIQGYEWKPDRVQSGGPEQRSRFWLLWQVLWLSPEDTHFFVQLLDSNMLPWGQQDSVGYPTKDRQKGDRVINKFDITRDSPKAGAPVWARAGLYLYPEIINLPLVDEMGQTVGDTVLIGRPDG